MASFDNNYNGITKLRNWWGKVKNNFQYLYDAVSGLVAGELVTESIFNVKNTSYGAEGDGITDDRTALYDANAAAVLSGGGQLYFPVGTYLISSNLTLGDASIGIKLVFAPGALLKPASSSVTITFVNCEISDTLSQIFDLSAGGKLAGTIKNATIQAETLGFVKDDATFDCGQLWRTYMDNCSIQMTVFFGEGTWRWTDTCIRENTNMCIEGISGAYAGSQSYSTVFSPYETSQTYVIKIGGYENSSTPTDLMDIYFTGYKCKNLMFSDDDLPVSDSMFIIEYCSGIDCGTINFSYLTCRGLKFRNCWELHFDRLYFRQITRTDSTYSVWYIDESLDDGFSNTSAIVIGVLDVERINCCILKQHTNAKLSQMEIGICQIEHDRYEDAGSIFLLNDLSTAQSSTKVPLFLISPDGLTIGILNIQSFGKYKYVEGAVSKLNTIFEFDERFNVAIGQLNLTSCGGWVWLATGIGAYTSHLNIGSITFPPFSSNYVQRNTTSGDTMQTNILHDVTTGNIDIGNCDCIINPTTYTSVDKPLYIGHDLLNITPKRYSIDTIAQDGDITVVKRLSGKANGTDNITRNLTTQYNKMYMLLKGESTVYLHTLVGAIDTVYTITGVGSGNYELFTFDIPECDYFFISLSYAGTGDLFIKKIEFVMETELPDTLNKIECDFLNGTSGVQPWSVAAVASGTASGGGGTDVTYDHPGMIVYSSIASSNTGYRAVLLSYLLKLAGREKTIFCFKTGASVVGVTRRMGFHNSVDHNAPTDGAYIKIAEGVLTGNTANNSTLSATATNYTLSADTWYRVKIELNIDATLATFTLYEDNTNTVLWTDTLSTNIPTTRTVGHGDVCTNSVSEVAVIGKLDYVALYLFKRRII